MLKKECVRILDEWLCKLLMVGTIAMSLNHIEQII